MTKGTLNGVRVLEVSLYVATPLCGRILASQGAEVIRVSSSKAIDSSWRGGPEPAGSVVPDFEAGKRHVALDLHTPEGKTVASKLIEKCDVLISNIGHEALRNFGLDYQSVREIKPDIVMVWGSAMGSEGPYAKNKAYGAALTSMAGLVHMTGFPDGPPTWNGTAFADFHSATYMSFLAVAALAKRRRTRQGVFIEVPLYEMSISCFAVEIMDYLANGRVANRIGNRSPFASPHGAYPCKGDDRWCVIAASTDEHWEALCTILGNPAWTKQTKFADLAGRIRNAADLDQLISEWSMSQSAEEIMEKMQKGGIPAGIVSKCSDLVESSHLKQRNFYQETMYPVYPFDRDASFAGPSLAMPVPVNFSETPCTFGPTGRIPEDNDYVYGQLLGMSENEIKRLTDEGVFK
ncbi:MAG: CoA transferase [Dehalococcoidia bacterium]|nr:CoA transferase [Dehalococcoidia bacterium]